MHAHVTPVAVCVQSAFVSQPPFFTLHDATVPVSCFVPVSTFAPASFVPGPASDELVDELEPPHATSADAHPTARMSVNRVD